MKIYFDKYYRPEQIKVYLATPNRNILCELNGIVEDTFSLSLNLLNTHTLSFDVDRYILDREQNEVVSNGYDLLDAKMRLYVDTIGWFIMETPSSSNDGKKETKTISAESCEIEMQQHDLKNLKINCGTTDSYEMLIKENVEIIDEVEFAKEQIKFYNESNPDLSFLNILLKVAGIYGWSIGYVDSKPKEYKYYEDGELKTKYVALPDEIGAFSIEIQDLYSFLFQDVSKYFNCIFVFNIKDLTINVYRAENLGEDTNINIGFRNLQQSNEITSNNDDIFTRYTVSGGDGLSIIYCNFGEDTIENLDYFLNEKYLRAELIEKYKIWKEDVESSRAGYIENTRLYNQQQNVISELYNRLPLDDCSTDWSTFSDDELLEAQANYQAQLLGYESFYVDDEGNFDQEALDSSTDANDYYQIKDVILPSIQIEIDNRQLSTDKEEAEYINSYETNWDLYGLDELQVKLDEYKNIIAVCEKGGYDVPYTSDSGHTEDYHTKMYEKYLDAQNQLNPDFIGSCQEAYNLRQSEIDDATAILEEYDSARKAISQNINKETWTNGDYYFTEQDIADLSTLYTDGTYTNENIFLLSSDDAASAIDEQLKLLDAAEENLYADSQPQFIYSTTLDNFLAKYEYKNYTDNLNLGDFIWLGVRDDYVVKLRVISISYNPLKMDNNLTIQFSNMIKTYGAYDDTSDLFGYSSGSSKSSVSGSSANYTSNEGVSLTSGLIQKLVSNGAFQNQMNQMIENNIAINGSNIISGSGGGGGGYSSIEELSEDMIKVVDIVGENAFFEYLQAKLISADKIVADSGNFEELSALVARIDNLLAGNLVAELGHVIELTADNVTISDAVIQDLIAAKITVGMLQAGDISADKFNIVSDDGGLEIVGNTMQFRDKDGNIRIQIGRDANNDFTFTLYNEDGTGVLIDDTGIHESAIADGLIVNDMVADGTLEKDKFAFDIVEGDGNGNIDIGKVTINGEGFEAEYISMKEEVSTLNQKIDLTATYTLYIEMPNGNTVLPSGIQMIAHLFKNSIDVTDEWDDSYFTWTRQSADSYGDIYWNENHATGTKTLTITANDVATEANFQCKFETDEITVVSE